MRNIIKTLWVSLVMSLALTAVAQTGTTAVNDDPIAVRDTVYTLHHINQQQFKQLVADWSASKWSLRFGRPVVVEFGASWCIPCQELEPILQELAQYYKGTIDFYSIDAERNADVANALKIRNIPTLLICPVGGEPQAVVGLYSRQELIRRIDQLTQTK